MTPLTPAVFHILLALAGGDRHGYGIMQDIAEHTDGSLRMGAGTLYGTIQRLMDAGLVREVESPPPQTVRDERRRHYRLTPAGRRALDAEVQRLEELVRLARGVRPVARSKG
jgi:DNA-binding PadR family transcriptional regulator